MLCGNETQSTYIKGLTEKRKEEVYHRISDNPLENKFVYKGWSLFEKKHLVNVKYDIDWFPKEELEKERNPFHSFLSNIWEYIYISIVNKNNVKGLFEACFLYGRAGLKTEF